MGRRDIGDARKFTKSLIGFSSVLFLVTSLSLFPFLSVMMELFSAPKEIIPTIYTLIIMTVFAQPILWASSFIMPTALRAAGDSNFTSIASLLCMWLIRVVLGYVLGITLLSIRP